MKKVLISVVLCALCASLALGQEGDILDLTLPQAVKPRRYDLNGGVPLGRPGAVSGDKQEDSPIKVSLDRVSRESCQIGDEVTYEVTLENVSNESFLFPLLRDQYENDVAEQAQFNGNHTAFLKAEVALIVEDEAFNAGVRCLYGIKFVPETVRIVRPGQKLRIRSSGKITFAYADSHERVIAEMPKRCVLRAELTLLSFKRIGVFMPQYKPAVSSNSVTIELRKYEPPNQ